MTNIKRFIIGIMLCVMIFSLIPPNLSHAAMQQPVVNEIPSEPSSSLTRGYDDGQGSYLFALTLQYGLVNQPTYSWHPGSFKSSVESIIYHYKKHGKSVGATSASSYLNKAIEWRKNGKKSATKSNVSGSVYGVIRYKKNGYFIDLAPDNRIISFGRS